MIDTERLITAWIDLDLAYRHLHSFGNEVLEAAHWLRIAWLNIKAAYDGDMSDVALIKMSDTLKEMSDKFDIVAFNTHGTLGATRERPIPPAVEDLSPKIEEIKKNLRAEIDMLLHEQTKTPPSTTPTLDDFGYSGLFADLHAKIDFYFLAMNGLEKAKEVVFPISEQKNEHFGHMVKMGYITTEVRDGSLYAKITPKGLKFFEWYKTKRNE